MHQLKNNLRQLTFHCLIIAYICCGCTYSKAPHFDNSWSNLISSSNEVTTGTPIDCFFNYSLPTYSRQDSVYVYIANPECSFCISTALDCYNEYLKSSSHSKFIFLLKSDYTNLFEFYAKRDLESVPTIISSEFCSNLNDGLYIIIQGKAIRYLVWPSYE